MRASCRLLAAVFLFTAGPLLAAQYYQPKSIHFTGAPEFTDRELMEASGLKTGVAITPAEIQSRSQKLIDSGLFETLNFQFDGTTLTYTLVPAANLYPLRLENLPLAPGKELDAALHARVPLYHGKVPDQSGLTEQVRKALEEMLTAKGIQATVADTAYTDAKLGQITAISYMITSPPVLVGEIRPSAASTPLDASAQEILAKVAGSPYNVQGSPNQIETYLGNDFHDKGYLEAEIHAAALADATVASDALRIPFQVTATPGIRYKLAAIRLAPGLPLSQEEFDNQSRIHPGDLAANQLLTNNWIFLEGLFHNRGYMEATVHPTPSFDREHGTVTYNVTVDPGPVYTMGKLAIQNGADDLRAAMLDAWKLPEGAVYNEGAVKSFYANLPPTSRLARTMTSANLKYSVKLNRDSHTVDITLRMERMQ